MRAQNTSVIMDAQARVAWFSCLLDCIITADAGEGKRQRVIRHL
jgi:hypothetical protein